MRTSLLLALLCNIYRGEGYLPRNRPDIYERCADMLFRRWDKGRGIKYLLPFEAHIEPAIMHLAYWIYSDTSRQSGVAETDLVPQVTEYLQTRQFDDEDEARLAAQAFIEFCRGRAWVFTDTGTTKDGRELYQFSHRTFLEYFAAAYLVRIHRTPNDLVNFLLPRIREREWDVVAQLSLQMQNKRFEEAGDELLSALLDYAKNKQQNWNIFSFIVRCLEFIVPSPSINKAIVKTCINHILEWGASHLEYSNDSKLSMHNRSPARETHIHPAHLINDLRNVAQENRRVIGRHLKSNVIELFRDGNELEKYMALQIVTGLPAIFTTQRVNDVSFWRAIEDEILQECAEYITPLRAKYFDLYVWAGGWTKNSIGDMVNCYGVQSIFQSAYQLVVDGHYPSCADWLIESFMSDSRHNKHLTDYLQEIYEILLFQPVPWLDTRYFHR